MRKKLGECLIQAGLITEDDLQFALAEHKRTGERLGMVLVRLNLATERQIAKALAYQLGFPYLNLTENPPEPAVVQLIPKDVALKRFCVAIRLEKNLLTVAMADPLLFSLVQDLEFQSGYRIKQVVATRADIIEAIGVAYPDKALIKTTPATGSVPASRAPERGSGGGSEALMRRTDEGVEPIAGLKERSEAAPIVDLVDLVVKSAIKANASDVHVEPMEKGVLIRHRLDGMLKEVMDLPKWVHEGLIARLKVMAGMDIAEKRLPQDGRVRITTEDGKNVDFRASTLRTLHGEKMVLRVLDQHRGVPPLEELGFPAAGFADLKSFLKFQHGMILVVGPTGSGKTTTLCSALMAMQSERTNIITIEDPIEYQLPGINQTQVNEKIKLTFAGALRSILRQDPDVILVGEIRDEETARIAMQAAQTGHLVLTTLHTDDAPSVMTRLSDIGVEPYVIASATIGVVAQRLVRRLCGSCRRQYTPNSETLRALNITEADAANIPFYHAAGCDACHGTGYKGRIGIYEVMKITDRLRRMIAQKASEDAIREAALSSGMLTLGDDALAKVKAGVTTAEELLRVVTEVREMRSVCPGCSGPVALDFVACPNCGRRLSSACSGCGRGLQPGWTCCPYCAKDTEGRAERRLRERRVAKELPAASPSVSNVAEFKKGSSSIKTHYELLGLDADADADAIKKAFRREIARYHPDKVIHLGTEFQDLAATRAAELTVAYKTLTDPALRQEYDATIGTALPPSHVPPAPTPEPREERPAAPPPPEQVRREKGGSGRFAAERAGRDSILKRAIADRVYGIVETLYGKLETPAVRGFDLVMVPVAKPRFLGAPPPRVLLKVVDRVDANAITEVYAAASRARLHSGKSPVVVLLFGVHLAPQADISKANEANLRQRKGPDAPEELAVVIVHTADWSCRLPPNSSTAVQKLTDQISSRS